MDPTDWNVPETGSYTSAEVCSKLDALTPPAMRTRPSGRRVDECLARLDKRSDSPTVYEKKDILNRIAQNYEATLDLYEKSFGPVVRIDGTDSVDAVHKAIVEHVTKTI